MIVFTFFTKSLMAINFPSSLPTNTKSCSTVLVVVFLIIKNINNTVNVFYFYDKKLDNYTVCHEKMHLVHMYKCTMTKIHYLKSKYYFLSTICTRLHYLMQ